MFDFIVRVFKQIRKVFQNHIEPGIVQHSEYSKHY